MIHSADPYAFDLDTSFHLAQDEDEDDDDRSSSRKKKTKAMREPKDRAKAKAREPVKREVCVSLQCVDNALGEDERRSALFVCECGGRMSPH